MHLFLSCLKTSQSDGLPERLAQDQAVFLDWKRFESSEENHGFVLSLILSFLNGACLSTIAKKLFIK